MIPIADWFMECEALDDAITKTIEANASLSLDVKTFYCPPDDVFKWYREKSEDFVINLDASQYDASVGSSEIDWFWDRMAGDYPWLRIVKEYNKKASIVVPQPLILYRKVVKFGLMATDGGQKSGEKNTNLLDGITNFEDTAESFEAARVYRTLKSAVVNGDDESVLLSEHLTRNKILQICEKSRRTLNPEKFSIGRFLFNSKWYMDKDLYTRPVFRALNSTMFTERFSDPLQAGKEYQEIAIVQIMKDIEHHPWADKVYSLYRKHLKYHISQFDDSRLMEAANQFLLNNSWDPEFEDLTAKSFIRLLRSTPYGKG
jgi:hypothetical protein